jgi:hypothetical protein
MEGLVLNDVVQRTMLVTYHGTVVYFDPTSDQLRHSALGSCAPNVFAILSGENTTLLWQDGDTVRPLGRFSLQGCGLAEGGGASRLSAVTLSSGLMALCHDGYFLCADAGTGLVTRSRQTALTWESFLPLDAAAFSALELICANKWVWRAPDGRLEIKAAKFTAAFQMSLGRARFPIAEILRARRPPGAARPARDMYVNFGGWKFDHFALYRPLAYFAAYGKEEIFDCLELALRSLFEFGEWDGDVLIITDDAHAGFASRLPAAYRSRILLEIIPARDVLDFTLVRYKVADLSIAHSYQPLIYLDTDIICDAPVQEFLKSLCLSNDLEICPEYTLGAKDDWYGTSLLEADGIYYTKDDAGISSGVIAFKDAHEKRSLFQMVVNTANRWAASSGTRHITCYDQPFLNYVLRKLKPNCRANLRRHVHLYFNTAPLLQKPVLKGFVHFMGGVGNAAPKLLQMRNYYSVLQRCKYDEPSQNASADAPEMTPGSLAEV